ncbi:MAG: family 10 glycosylhydrolase [Gemmatimonadaceae bacterium]|nr:family 10 glycosylhydrolase [Gemmatimonadaceae bacterium]
MRTPHQLLAGLALVLGSIAASPVPLAPQAMEPPAIRREFRGVWVASVANIDWPSRPGLSSWAQQTELLAILDRVKLLKMNAVLLQVRPAGDAMYASTLEPWSAYLTGVEGRAPEPYYDPLAFAVKEAHARGLELHAWFNPYRARHPTTTGEHGRTHMSVTHPEWVHQYGTYTWMDPGEPGVLEHSLRVVLDVVRRYDVDGIHVDDYFYPYPINGADSLEVPFPDSGSYARYQQRGGTLGRSDWRRFNVDEYVRLLYQRTKAVKPWVKVGISPFGIWRPGYPESIRGFDSYEKLAGDSRKWLNNGWVDYFTPQLYWPIAQTAQSYPVLLDWWLQENTKARHMWVGHSASREAGNTFKPGEINAQLEITRSTVARDSARLRATGDVLFSMKALMPMPTDTSGRRPAERLQQLYADDALIPASPWLGRTKPGVPTARVLRDAVSREWVLHVTPSARARWITVRTARDGVWTTQVHPSSNTQIVIGPATLESAPRTYLTAVDRNGNESAAVLARAITTRGGAR